MSVAPANSVPRIVLPPRNPLETRSRRAFDRLFVPLQGRYCDFLWEASDVPIGSDGRHWWTLIDCEGQLLLEAGFHVVNRLGFVHCLNAWGGHADQHPLYRY